MRIEPGVVHPDKTPDSGDGARVDEPIPAVQGAEQGIRARLRGMVTTPVGMLMAGSLVSSIGRSIVGYGAMLSVSVLTNSPQLTGFVSAARSLASLLSTLPAGAVADRFDQRRVIVLSSSIGIGAATIGALAVGFAGFLTPVALTAAVGASVFLTTAADSFADSSQFRYSQRFTANKAVNEQRQTIKLDLLQGELAGTMGSFLGPALAVVQNWVPFVASPFTYALNLGTLRKVHNDFGEPPQLGGGDKTPHNRHDDASEPSRDDESAAEMEGSDRALASVDDRTPGAENAAEPSKEHASAGSGSRTRERIRTIFGAAWKDPYLRSLVFLGVPIGQVSTGLQAMRLVEVMSGIPGWYAGLVVSASGIAGIAGIWAADIKVFRNLSVKSMFPATMAAWGAATIASAIWLSPLALAASLVPASVLGLAGNNKLGTYMHDVDKTMFNGKHMGGMRGVQAFTATIGNTVGALAGGYLVGGIGVSATGFTQAGVLAVAALTTGLFGFRYRKPKNGPTD